MAVPHVQGDLFECFEDLEDPDLWQSKSEYSELQQEGRVHILSIADHIIPGHGEMFCVPVEYRKQMRVVMFHEEHISLSQPFAGTSGMVSESKCIVVEADEGSFSL